MDIVILLFEVPRDEGRYGGLHSAWLGLNAESNGFQRAREIFSNHSLSAESLRGVASSLDRLGRTSEAFKRSLELELAIYKQDLSRGPADWWGAVKLPSRTWWDEWRLFGSKRLQRAEAIVRLNAAYKRGIELLESPSKGRLDRMDELQAEFQRDPSWVVRCAAQGCTFNGRRDAMNGARWILLRVATAMALYQAVRGESPASLSDLVPGYLPSIPRCPLTGDPLGFSPGKVWSPGLGSAEESWVVKRR